MPCNPIHNRFMRLAMYVHKRQHGVTVVVRRKLQVQADTTTGQTQWDITQWKVRRLVVLPREASAGGAAERGGDGGQPGDRARLFLRYRRPAVSCLTARKFPVT